MSETYNIVVEIDPSKALEGTAKIDRATKGNADSVREFERAAREAMREVEKAASAAAKAQEKAAREAERVQTAAARAAATAQKAAAREVEETARAITIAAERRARERAQVEAAAAKAAAAAKTAAAKEAARVEEFAAKRTADYSRQVAAERKAAQDRLAASYRQIVGPAAEYRAQLNQILQLERQGAITAQQRANAVRGLQREMAQHNAKQQGGVRGAVSEIASSQFGAVAGPAAAAAVAIKAGQELVRLGDEYTSLSNKIRTSTESEIEASVVRERLFKSAAAARVSVQSLTDIYSQARIATRNLGTSQAELLRVSELLAKATRGVSEANRSAGLQQFGQALTKGKLQAEELMSIMENIPKVGVLLAEGMGMTVGELRKLAEQGKVSTQDMLDAIQKVGPEIEEQFGKAAGTSAESFQVLKDKVMQIVGGFAEQIHLTEGLSVVLESVGEALTVVGQMVNMAVDNWKAINDATGGWLGKLAKAGGLLNAISDIEGRIAGQYLFGADMLLRQKDLSQQLAALAERQTAEKEKQLQLDQTMLKLEHYQRGVDGRAVGYGVLGNYLRNSVDASNNPSRRRVDKQEEREAAAAARDHATAVREAAAAWKEWLGDVRQGGAGVLERVKLRIDDTADSLRDVAAESIAAAEEMRAFNDNAQAFAEVLGTDLLDSLSAASDMVAEFVDTAVGEESVAKVDEFSTALNDQLASALNDTLDAIVDLANGGKVSFSELARSVVADLERMILKMLIFEGLKAAIGGGAGGGLLTAVGKAFGFDVGSNAAGGSYTVPASGGGVDSVPFFGRATPGERITITPPGQAERGAAPQPVNVNAYLVHDAEAASIAALNTPAGSRAIIAAIAANPGAVRAAVGR
jgi:tape measure domain-containing protein